MTFDAKNIQIIWVLALGIIQLDAESSAHFKTVYFYTVQTVTWRDVKVRAQDLQTFLQSTKTGLC